MKTGISILLIAFLSFLFSLYLPWWSIALAAFLVVLLIPKSPLESFLNGFTAIFLLWGFMAAAISCSNGHMLGRRISILLLKNDNVFILILVTAFLGATVAGFAALSAVYLRKLIKK